MIKARSNIFLKYFALMTLMSCGLVELGSSSLNEPVPDGTVVFTGTFGTNSNSISGTVFVYQQAGTNYTVRFETFSSATITNLKVQGFLTGSSTAVLDSALKGTGGNQNYSVSGVTTPTWSTIKIISTAIASPNNILATALLD
jgi:hypothetical protein